MCISVAVTAPKTVCCSIRRLLYFAFAVVKICCCIDFICIDSNEIHIYNARHGPYQQSVTLTARMWPPVEAGTPSTIWGLPAIVWGSLIACFTATFVILALLYFCCWFIPKEKAIFSPVRRCHHKTAEGYYKNIMNQRPSITTRLWYKPSHIAVPVPVAIVPQYYNVPPNPEPVKAVNSEVPVDESPSNPAELQQNVPETYRSMWSINPLYASNFVLNDSDSIFKSRSLPSWGKTKQRPVSTADDIEELYAKVNFCKKRRNRMRNDEAAIIALCRSRSQNLAGLPLEREGVVIYDERTAL